MSAITSLLDSLKATAKADYAADIAPVLSSAVPTILANPSGAAAVGLAVLAQLEAAAAKVGADEVANVAAWTVTEVQQYAASITAKLTAAAPAAA